MCGTQNDGKTHGTLYSPTALAATADRRLRRAPRGTAELITALRATAAATRPTANTALGATADRRLRRAPHEQTLARPSDSPADGRRCRGRTAAGRPAVPRRPCRP